MVASNRKKRIKYLIPFIGRLYRQRDDLRKRISSGSYDISKDAKIVESDYQFYFDKKSR